MLDGKTPLLVTVNRAQDIVSALRLAEEFGIRIVLDGAAEAYLVLDEIRRRRRAGDPPPDDGARLRRAREPHLRDRRRARGGGDPVRAAERLRGLRAEDARRAVRGRRSPRPTASAFDDALAAITIDAAKILGVDERVGSLEPGKDGDVALFDGDPFEYTTHVTGVVIEGVVVSEASR